MTNKKPSLAAAMSSHDTRAAVQQVTELPERKLPERQQPIAMQPGRVGKKQVLGYFTAECKKQLKLLGVENDKTEQDLLAEALNLLFAKHGKPTIA